MFQYILRKTCTTKTGVSYTAVFETLELTSLSVALLDTLSQSRYFEII